jgi:hypothetical protein
LNFIYFVRYCLIAFASLAIVWACIELDSPSIRYLEYRHQCEMIYSAPSQNSVDLAVAGSSRSMRAMNAELLSDLVFQEHGSKPEIIDISRSYRDLGHIYVFLSDLLQNADVDMLLVEYKESGQKRRHPNFHLTAGSKQIRQSFNSRPFDGYLLRVHEQVTAFSDRIVNRSIKFISKNSVLSANCAKVGKPVKTRDPSKPWYAASELLKKLYSRNNEDFILQPFYDFDLDDESESRNNFYAKKIVDLAKERGVKLRFYYIPPLYGRPLSDSFKDKFEAKFDSILLQLPLEQLIKINPMGYTDATHMSHIGSEAYMRYLVNELPWNKSK